MSGEAPAAPTRAEAFRYWLRLGCISFGGPAGQIAIMHRELVDERRWISERRFLHAQGCDEIQGYLCSRPLPAAECERFLRTQLRLPSAAATTMG